MKWLMGVLGASLVVLMVIAASDRLFLRAVPLEQRLISANEGIRQKAQQELLGRPADAKAEIASRLIPTLTVEDPSVRKWAAISLALIGPPAQPAIPALLHGVTDAHLDVAQACRVALSEIGTPEPEQLPTLMQSLQDPHQEVRCEAALGLSKMGPAAKAALPLFIKQIETPEALECVMHATAMLAGMLPEEMHTLLALTRDPSAAVRRRSVHVISMLETKTPEVWTTLCQILADDTDSRVRWATARALTLPRPPDRGVLPSLTRIALRARKEEIRAAALELLKKTDWPLESRVNVLTTMLEHDDAAELRLRAAQELADLAPAPRSAAASLLAALHDDDERVRQTALLALRSMTLRGHETILAVARLQRDSRPNIRCLASQQLVEMGAWDRVAVNALATDLANGESESCTAEALAMDGHFNPTVVPALMPILRGSAFEPRRRAAYVLMQLGSRAEEALPLLARAQKDGVPGAQMAMRSIRDSLGVRRRRHVTR
jgi:HEAT repeat protein